MTGLLFILGLLGRALQPRPHIHTKLTWQEHYSDGPGRFCPRELKTKRGGLAPGLLGQTPRCLRSGTWAADTLKGQEEPGVWQSV